MHLLNMGLNEPMQLTRAVGLIRVSEKIFKAPLCKTGAILDLGMSVILSVRHNLVSAQYFGNKLIKF